ncbi:MAG: hypothetical protein JWN63_3419 [Candidatus Acidoferrum typicum]|nr:hypothetical protein [Candidatus Acidoferrum typicum]
MAQNARDKFWRKAIAEASKRIKVLSDKKLNANLDYAAGSLADAYNIGVQEAQMEITDRLKLLQDKLTAPPKPPSHSASEGQS